MKRLIVVADNSLIVDAVRIGLRDTGTFELLGYVAGRTASASIIADANPDVVLVDDTDQSEQALALIHDLKERREHIVVIVLTVRMSGRWLERALEAGASGAISKAIQPGALATLVREALSGHIVHSPASISGGEPGGVPGAHHSSLTRRELEVLRLVASGATNREIATKLWVTEQTVKFHLSNIYRKLEVGNRTEASHYAHVNGLVMEAAQVKPAS